MTSPSVTTATPGNLVVPLSAIIDQLQGKLSAADLNVLLSAVVGQKKNRVLPGDLIRADFFNQILSDLEDLNLRVAKLETQGSETSTVRIDGFRVNQPLRVKDAVELDGAGFLVPAVLNTVTMGGMPVLNLSQGSSTSTALYFQVPDIPNVVPSGSSVTVTVENDNGRAVSPQIVVFPQLLFPKGQTQLLYTGSPVMPSNQPNITPGQTYSFIYGLRFIPSIDSSLNQARYTIAANVTGTGWNAAVLETQPIATDSASPAVVHVQVTAGSGVGQLSLVAKETTTGSAVSPANQGLPITANAPPPVPDNRIRVLLAGADGGASPVGGSLQFKRGIEGGVGFTVFFTEKGDYTVMASLAIETGWTPKSIGGAPMHIDQPGSNQPNTQDVGFAFTAGLSAQNTDLLFVVQRPADGLSVTYSQPVTVVG